MEAHPGLFGLQTAAIESLRNLTKRELFGKIDLSILKQVEGFKVTAMQNLRIHYQVSIILNLCRWLPVPASAVCSSLLPITIYKTL
jgi:hypothetical protein